MNKSKTIYLGHNIKLDDLINKQKVSMQSGLYWQLKNLGPNETAAVRYFM